MKIVCGVFACILLVGAVCGGLLSLTLLAGGKGLPNDPAQRAGFIFGVFLPPLICGVGGSALGYVALTHKKAAKRKRVGKKRSTP